MYFVSRERDVTCIINYIFQKCSSLVFSIDGKVVLKIVHFTGYLAWCVREATAHQLTRHTSFVCVSGKKMDEYYVC